MADTPFTIAKIDSTRRNALTESSSISAPSRKSSAAQSSREIPLAIPVATSSAPQSDLDKLRKKLSGLWREKNDRTPTDKASIFTAKVTHRPAETSVKTDSLSVHTAVAEVASATATPVAVVAQPDETDTPFSFNPSTGNAANENSRVSSSLKNLSTQSSPLVAHPIPTQNESDLSVGREESQNKVERAPIQEPVFQQTKITTRQNNSGLFGRLFNLSATNRKNLNDRSISTSSGRSGEADKLNADSRKSPTPLSNGSASSSGEGHAASQGRQKGIFKGLFVPKKTNPPAKISPPREREQAPRTESALSRFPKAEAQAITAKPSRAEDDLEEVIREIQKEYEGRVDRIAATDLKLNSTTRNLDIPRDLESAWYNGIRRNLWQEEEKIAVPLREAYARALINSNQVRVLSYAPLISETAIIEADSQLDPEVFSSGRRIDTDRPTNTTLDTGEIGRFIENRSEGEAGIRKQTALGGQFALSNRFTSLKNNSVFTTPNPQTSSNLVLSVRQPLLKGGGYDYNKANLKIAKLEAGSAAGDYIRGVESHLLDVNRAYWEVYLARSAYLLRKSLSEQTERIVERLDARSDEATASELLRAQSELSKRRTGVTRSEMDVRNAEERLRALVNDPLFPIGGAGEFIPVTRPILESPGMDVKRAAREAIENRPEIAQSYDRLRAANIVVDAGKREMLPQLDIFGETSLAGIDGRRDLGGAYDNMFDNDSGWVLGFEYSQPLERRFSKARQERRQYEFLQQAEVVRQTINNVLLESVVAYRELITSYRAMQGRYQEVLSTREEVGALRERLEVDSNNNQTVATRLQLIMDALERNQLAEEQFLVSVVSYNIAFAELDQAKGVFLNVQDINVEREGSKDTLDSLNATTPLTR